jgi:hypothetical protein
VQSKPVDLILIDWLCLFMELSFTYTLDDYREGLAAVRKPMTAGKKRSRERLWVGLATGAAVLGLVIVVAVTQQTGPSGELIPTFWSIFATTLVPWAMVIGVLWALLVPRQDDVTRPAIRQMMLIVLFAGIASALIGAWNPPPAPAAPEKPATLKEILLPFLPWAVVFFAIWTLLFRIISGLPRRAWDGQPHLKLPHRIRFSEASVEVESPAMRTTYQWSAFMCFRETKNLFILQPSKLIFVMIPKRACAGGAEIEALRRMLEERVPNANPAALGFAVVSKTPPPLPRMVESLPPRTMN